MSVRQDYGKMGTQSEKARIGNLTFFAQNTLLSMGLILILILAESNGALSDHGLGS